MSLKDLIAKATFFLKGKILRTPLEFSKGLSEMLGVPVYLKMESLQITGSFKVRGALFYLSTLSEAEKKKGISACSAGNHGLGVAFAAREHGVSCTVYVPKGSDSAKKKKILETGAQLLESELIGYDETLIWAQERAKETGQHFITAFDDERIIAGNGGSIGVEILEDLPDVKNIVLPISGGGLGAGVAFATPGVRIIGCQLRDSAALKLSLQAGKAITSMPAIKTIAGGLEGGIGKTCFEILKERIFDLCLVSDRDLLQACHWMLEEHHHLIEPSGAAAVAACLKKRIPKLTGKTVFVLSGRNMALSLLQRTLNADLH
jgi:threonine dehydratase